jgi:hypothetical protein
MTNISKLTNTISGYVTSIFTNYRSIIQTEKSRRELKNSYETTIDFTVKAVIEKIIIEEFRIEKTSIKSVDYNLFENKWIIKMNTGSIIYFNTFRTLYEKLIDITKKKVDKCPICGSKDIVTTKLYECSECNFKF